MTDAPVAAARAAAARRRRRVARDGVVVSLDGRLALDGRVSGLRHQRLVGMGIGGMGNPRDAPLEPVQDDEDTESWRRETPVGATLNALWFKKGV